MGNSEDKTGNRERAQSIFRTVFEDPDLLITESTTAAEIPNWDSLTHINLIISLEEEFGIQFSAKEVTSMAKVGDLFLLLDNKL